METDIAGTRYKRDLTRRANCTSQQNTKNKLIEKKRSNSWDEPKHDAT